MSESYNNFLSSLGLARSLYEIEKNNYKNPPTHNQITSVQGLRGGTAVLCIASFENFLRMLFEEKLSVLSSNPPLIKFEQLPDSLKISSIYFSLERAMKGKRYDLPKDKIDRIPDIVASAKTIGYIIDPTCFSDTGNNPNPDNVKKMFKDIGITDIFAKIKLNFEAKWSYPVSDNFIADKLKAIVNRRHVVAHTADTLNISRSDLTETFKFLTILSECLDQHLNEYIKNL